MTTTAKFRIIWSVTTLLLLSRESVSLFFNSSYIETKPLDIAKQFSLAFRTCKGGTLLRQSGNNSYFELEVVPGMMNFSTDQFTRSSLALRWKIGNSKESVLNVGGNLDQNIPYSVMFIPKTSTHDATLSVSLGSSVDTVNVSNTIYNVGSENLTLGQGFIGCITFGDVFDTVNAKKKVGTSANCSLDNGERCSRSVCPKGYKGYYCEVNIDECASSPCHHASTCIDGIANYTCQCGPAWSGRNCDYLNNETLCDSEPCLNRGICHLVSDFNNYTCTCPTPYTGRNCNETLDPCGSQPCQNNATMSCTKVRDTDFRCTCLKGYTGKRCEININDCALADCGRGVCIDGIDNHTCNCTGSGFSGSDCKQDINECTEMPCKHSGSCSNHDGGYQCKCHGDYRGKNCEERIDDCASNPCKNGGNCTDLTKDFSCVCAPGYSGNTCETKLHDCNLMNIGCTACNVAPCNHGECNCTCTENEMYYNCTCEEGYIGENCNQDINECMNGSVPTRICGDNGTCLNTNGSFRCDCSEGFTGRYCNETVGACNPNPCMNGICHRINITTNSSINGSHITDMETYNCSCYSGWRGVNCTEDIDECVENNPCNITKSVCENRNGSYKCLCKKGYEGENCADINECKRYKPCKNGGICKNNDGDYRCFCDNGYTDKNCTHNIDDCTSQGGHQCIHGVCVDKVARYECVCDVGWMGRFCNVDVNECGLGYCEHNATCNNTDGNYTCTCKPGYKGRNCSTNIDECAEFPCAHNETCTDKINDFECNCSLAYEGKSCEIDIDWCNATRNNGSIPCDYGTCHDGEFNYTCRCFDGFSGQNCDIDEDECLSIPCNNSGICVQKSNATEVKMYFGADRVYPKNESAGYLCVCQPGFNGSNCENNIDECALYKACNETGTMSCEDAVNNYTCRCKAGFTGRNCSIDIDECSSTPCQNNGTCQNLIGEYRCICDTNHTGMDCESLVDPCTRWAPCRNGATCDVLSDFNFTCTCVDGYAGRLCTDTTTLGFDGTSSMTIIIPHTTNTISFSFRTNFREGVLVSHSGAWALSLLNGKLRLACMDSDGCEIGETGSFSDSSWRGVGVAYDSSSVFANASFGECNVECGASRGRRSLSRAESKLIVGAHAGDSDGAKFVGSIRDFSVNDVKYYPGVNGVVTDGSVNQGYQRQNVCSPDPCVNGRCGDLWTRYICECDRYWTSTNCTEVVRWGTFGVMNPFNSSYRPTSNKSIASYSVSGSFNTLVFAVRTRATSSLIIQLKFNDSVYLSVETDGNGYLRLRDKNGFINSPSSGGPKINDGIQHYIQINHTLMTVDNTSYGVNLKSLPIRSVFIGGLPRTGDEVGMHGQFRGCTRDVRMNGQQLLFFNQTKDEFNATEWNVARGCLREDVCANISGSEPCSSRGNCTDLWNDHECACQFPFGGDKCELYGCEWTNPCPENGTCMNLRDTSEYECVNEVTFNESQSSAFFTNSTPLSDLNSVVIQFRTRQNNTVILSSVHNTTNFQITVDDGRTIVSYNLTENVTGTVNTDVFVSDGNWHELRIESSSSKTDFKIFAVELEQDKLTYLNTSHSVSRNVSLLSHSFTNLLSMAGVRIGSSPVNTTNGNLLGCLREIRLGKHLLKFHANVGENNTVDSSSPDFSLAKSAFMIAGLNNIRFGCHSNNMCTSSLCGNGTCVQGWNVFHCACPAGYYGDRCEFNPCTSSPCTNSTCTVHESGFKCSCTESFCKNGGKCEISDGERTCICESGWTGEHCDTAIPRGGGDDDNLPLIIGLAVAGGVLLLLVIAVIFVCTRQTSSTFGTYSPSTEEKAGARVEMDTVLNVPPPEKLI